MTQDADGSAPMLGSQPVAWAVMLADGRRIWGVYDMEEEAHAIDDVVAGGHGVVPLYRSPALTDEEREAIADAAGRYVEGLTPDAKKHAAALRGLLDRLG